MTDQLKEIIKRRMKAIEDTVVKDTGFKNAVGELITARVKKRTVDGYGVDAQNESKKKFKELSEGYIKFRKKNKSELGENATVAKSNLHFTGSMVDSIHHELNGEKIEIKVTAQHQDKAGWAAEKGRKFLHLSNLDVKAVKELIKNKVKEILNLLNSK